MISVTLPDGRTVETKKRRVHDILRDVGFNENSALVEMDGMLITPDISLEPDAKIRIISVVSGG